MKMRRSMSSTLTQDLRAGTAVSWTRQIGPRFGRRGRPARATVVVVTAPASAFDPVAIADWRRQVAQMYAEVRRIAAADPQAAHGVWVQQRDEMFASHPASPLDVVSSASFAGLDVAPYDPAFRFEVAIEPAGQQRMDVGTTTDGVVPFERIGTVELGALGSLALWALKSYAGGLFLPVRDALAGTSSYGGGRYVLDTVKGADHGMAGDRVRLDPKFPPNPPPAPQPAGAGP